jgi:hypothetical protein
MDTTKIRLSSEEEALLIRADWILTKNRIIEKTKQLLAGLQKREMDWLEPLSAALPKEVTGTSPKISKGENYKGLPWLILDYPRYFNKEDSFAIRMFFWWGNFFSGTLFLAGHYKKKYEDNIIRSLDTLATNDFYICISEDAWQHHFEPDNYKPLTSLSSGEFTAMVKSRPFIKLAKKIPLQTWNEAESKLADIFGLLVGVVTD